MGPCPFLPDHLFSTPTAKPIGPYQWIMWALKYVFWGPQTLWSLWHYFLGVNWSGPKASSKTNQRFYRALGQLHGPWCKQPLTQITETTKICRLYSFISPSNIGPSLKISHKDSKKEITLEVSHHWKIDYV